MSLHHDGKRIGRYGQFRPLVMVVVQADHREGELGEAAPASIGKLAGGLVPPLAQHCQADDRLGIAVKQSVVVAEHASSEIAFPSTLYFDMHQHPIGLPVAGSDLNQLVSPAPSQFGIPDHFLKFLVKEAVTRFPGDVRMGRRKKEGQKCWKVAVQSFFPRRIVIVGHDPFTYLRSVWPAVAASAGGSAQLARGL